MFDLEQSIADWRRQMHAAGIKTLIVEELESHLREEFELQMLAGLNAPCAFDVAVRQIGKAPFVKTEFAKIERNDMKRFAARLVKLMSIGCGAISFMLSLWCLQFLFYQSEVVPIILGLMAVATSVSSWKYGHKYLPVIHDELIRATIGFACSIASVAWIQFFIIKILPGLMEHPAGKAVAEGRLVATDLWACTVMAVLSGIGYGLEKAAREPKTANS